MEAKLKFNDKELILFKGVTTIGRAADNFISFSGDSNISRYHAEIESRGEDFYVIDLGSSNGTGVNGARISGDKLLKNGDAIVLGGSQRLKFFIEKEDNIPAIAQAENDRVSDEDKQDEYIAEQEAEIAEDSEKTAKPSSMLKVAAATCGLAVVAAVGATAYYFTRSAPKCEASAVISRPETGDVLKSETPIEVQTENAGCVTRAVFVLDDELVIDSTEGDSIASLIDPREYPELADGLNHSLKLILEDEEGNRIGTNEVLLAFETLATPTPTPLGTPEPDRTPKTVEAKKEVSLLDTQEMAKRLVKQFASGTEYRFDKRFLQEVQKKTAEYKTEGYSQRAANYRDTINEAFVKEQNIYPPLGFILAMSRSKFVAEGGQNGDEGLWRISKELVTSNSFDGTCEDKNLSDATQRCAAIATSVYMKSLANNIFENDFVYAVAAFGLSPLEASQLKDALPQNKQDFWLNLKTPQQREQIVDFFAAGIVAENPQKFGLKNDTPLSEMYKIFMTQ